MSRARIKKELTERYHAPAAAGYDVNIGFSVGEMDALVCWMSGDGITFDDSLVPDVTFFFDSAGTALSLLGGSGDFVRAFMDGKFRADGYLTLAFLLFAVFKGDAPPSVPT